MRDTIFSPSFGNRPRQIVGRDKLIEKLARGLESAPGSRERSVVILGQRGTGKTVLLWELADLAERLDYVVATPTIVSEGMLERVVEKIQDAGEEHVRQDSRHISGGNIGVLGFSAGLQFTEVVQETKSAQHKLQQLARKLNEYGKGLLILVDELQANSSDVKKLVIAYQEMIGEGLDVALIMGGLPGAVSATLNDKVLTFLNRARKVTLPPLAFSDVDAYFMQSFKELGIDIEPELRRNAASAVNGSPYLLQLVGHNIVSYSGDSGMVDEAILREAVDSAIHDFKNDICKTSLSALSDMDVSFLKAVAKLDSPAKMNDISNLIGKSSDYTQKYRTRLLDAGIIEAPARGMVSIAVPYLEDYLTESEG